MKDKCLFLEYLNFEVDAVIKTVWILDTKLKRPTCTQLLVPGRKHNYPTKTEKKREASNQKF